MKARRFGQSMLLVASLLALCLSGSSGPARATSNSFTAVDDSTVVTEDAPATAIDVLGNDVNDSGDPETIALVDTTGTHGDVRIAGVQPKRPPNIVFILTDDQSFESVAKMPFLGSRADWFSFSHAYLNNPVCCPARATLLTGQYSHHTGVENVGGAPRFDDSSTIATWLQDGGYHTGFYGKWHLGSIGPVPELYIPPGWDEYVGWKHIGGDEGNEAYYGYTLNDNGTSVQYGSAPQDYSTDVLADKAVDFLDRAAAARSPFFLYFAPRAPHGPWTAAPRHLATYKSEPVEHAPDYNEADMSDKPAWWRNRPVVQATNTDRARRKEWDTLLALDDTARRMYEDLKQHQLLSDTVIIFMTDNGFAFGEHRWSAKHCAYEECIHTPLLVWYPGVEPGQLSKLVSDVDLAPTIADLGGITPPRPVDGRSFVPLLNGTSTGWPSELLIRGYNPNDAGTPPTFWGLRTPAYKYIETTPTGEAELYDLASDPYELSNVAEQPEYVDTRAQLAQRLSGLRAEPPHTVESHPAEPDPGTYLTYEPDPGYCNDPDPGSTDTFTYTTSGGSTASVSVTVSCVDDAPIPFDDSVTLTQGDPATPTDVLANDRDVDGGQIEVQGLDTPRTVGSVVVTSSGSVEYTPAPHYCNDATTGDGAGPDDTFNYRLNGAEWATVYVTIRCVFAADGSGSLTTPKGYVRNGSGANTRAFTYTVAAGGLLNGALSLKIPVGWSPPSTTPGQAGYVVDDSTGSLSVSGQTVTVSGLTLSEGNTVVITYGVRANNGPGATAPTAPGPQSWVAKSRGTAGGTLVQLASSPQITVLAPDGSGTIEPSPALVDQSSSANTITFTYTAAAGGMVNGAITLTVPAGWSAPTTAPGPGLSTASQGTLSVSSRTITVAGLTLPGSQSMTLTYGSTSGGGPGARAPTTASAQPWPATELSSAGGTFVALASPPSVVVTVGVLDHFTVEAAAGGPVASQQAGVPFTVKISARDANNNTVTGFAGTVDLVANRPIAGGPFSTEPFVAGVLTQSITLTEAGLLSMITVTETSETGGTVSGGSNAFTVLTPDGSGSLTSPTTYVRNGSTGNTLIFTYTAPAGGMVNGALSLEVPAGWPDPSTSGGDPGYFVTNTGTRSVAGRTLVVSGVTRSEGQTVVVTYGARASGGPGATAPTTPGQQTWEAKSKMLATGSLASLASSPAVGVLSPDGSGMIAPAPAFVGAGSSANTIVFTYTAAAGGMVNGSLSLAVPTGWSAPSTASSAAGAVTASAGTAAVAGRTITVSGLTLKGNESVSVTYGSRAGTGPGAAAPTTAGSPPWMARQRSSASATLTSLAASPAVAVFAADGSGSLTTPTAYVRSGSGANTLAFTYTVAAGGISNGALSLQVPAGWSPPSSTAGDAGYVLTNTGSRSVSGRTITVTGLNRSEGQTVVITYGARTNNGPGATAPTASGTQSWVGKSRALAGGTLVQLASSPQIAVLAPDGSGSLTTPTAYVRSGSGANTLAFTYTVAAGGISNGALSLQVPAGWSPPSSTAGDAGYVLTNTGSRSVSGRTITVTGLNRSEGQTVVVTYGARASGGPGATAPTTPGQQTWEAKSKMLAGGTLVQLASSPQIAVLAPDGSGMIVPSPAFVDAGSGANTIVFTYTAAAGGMVNGSLSLAVPGGWSAPSTASSAPGAVTASAGTAAVAGRTITVSGLTLNGNESVTITYGSRTGTGPGASAPTIAGSSAWMARQRSSASGALASLAASPAVTVLPGP